MVKNALIITWDGYQDQEVIYPYYRTLEENFNVTILANKTNDKIHGILGHSINSDLSTSIFIDIHATNALFDKHSLLILPGGVKALEKLRQERGVLEFINRWNSAGKTISSTCHGAQLMISSKIVKGRHISGYYSIKDDIENAGAFYHDDPYVVDENIISSPHYKHMGPWMKATFDVHYNRNK